MIYKTDNNDLIDSKDNNNNLNYNIIINKNNDEHLNNSDNYNNEKNNLIIENGKIEEEEKIIKEKEEKKRVIVGLRNIRSNCYANSVLQCMYHIPQLTNYFISNNLFKLGQENDKDLIDSDNKTNKNSLSYKYYEVIYHLYYKEQNSKIINFYSPVNFLDYIEKERPQYFKPNRTNDPLELLSFLIENLKKELNKKEEIKDIENKSITTNYENNNENISLLYKKYLDDFKFNNNSIFDIYLYGIKLKIITCPKCNEANDFFKPFYKINFSLSEILKKNGNNQKITLNDCFEYYYNNKGKILKYFDKNLTCNNCNEKVKFSYYDKLYLSPKIMIITFDDAKQKGNLFDLNFEININDYFYEKNEGYKLFSVITYFKEKGMNEQYSAYCLSNEDGNWYCCCDDCIYIVNDPKKDMIEKNRFPYILFFKDNKIDDYKA